VCVRARVCVKCTLEVSLNKNCNIWSAVAFYVRDLFLIISHNSKYADSILIFPLEINIELKEGILGTHKSATNVVYFCF